jgi:hypothetical protein
MQLFVHLQKSMNALDQTLHAKFATDGGPTGPREDPLGSPLDAPGLGESEVSGSMLSEQRSGQMGSLPGSQRGQGLMSQAIKRSVSRTGSRACLARTISQTALDMHGEPEIWKVLCSLVYIGNGLALENAMLYCCSSIPQTFCFDVGISGMGCAGYEGGVIRLCNSLRAYSSTP